MNQESIKKSIYTNEVWLSANEHNKITPEQQALIKMEVAPPQDLIGLGAILAIGCGFFALIASLIIKTHWIPLGIFGLGVIVFSWFLYKRSLNLKPIKTEFASEIVGTGQGRVVYSDNRPVAEIGGEILKVCGELNLLPGTYQFYYLPQTHWLLSAQLKEMDKLSEVSDDNHESLLETLMKLHNFSQADLEANHQMRLSENQLITIERQSKISERQSRLMKRVGPYLVIVCLVAALLIFYFWGFTSQMTGLGAMALLLALVFGNQLISDHRVTRSSKVYKHEGVLRKRKVSRDPGWEYYYDIDGKDFIVPLADYEVIIEGLKYRLFSTTVDGGEILSIEPIVENEKDS